MKRYKLKKWYPSLPKEWKNQSGLVSFNTDKNGHEMEGVEGVIWIIGLHEFKDEDHWELIEEVYPLFVTEDGVYIYKDEWEMFAVEKGTFRKTSILSSNLMRHRYLLFNEEANADKYIWRNKRLFSYSDIEKFQSGGEGVFYDIKAIAKERSKE